MRIHRAAITSVLTFSALAFGLFWYNTVFASPADTCTVRQTGDGWSVSPDGQTITGTFVVQGLSCDANTDVSVMSWKADPSQLPNDQFWTNQTQNDVQTQSVGVGTHSITVKLPKCSGYQADIIAGDNPSPTLKPPGQGSAYDAKQPNGSSIVVASAIGDNSCSTASTPPTTDTTTTSTNKKKKPKTPTPPPITTPTTTPPPTHTFTPTTTIIPTPTSTPIVVAAAVKPAALPNTGPGETIALFVGVSVAAGLIHYFKFSRKHELEFVPDHGRPVILTQHYVQPAHHQNWHYPHHDQQQQHASHEHYNQQ